MNDSRSPRLDWGEIETVLLDMDGTLLDLHFDDFFWREHVPQCYATKNGLSLDEARSRLIPRFRENEGTLNWYCLDFWSDQLGLDIPELKKDLEHLIALRPSVDDFLASLGRLKKKRILVTNAHQASLQLKMERTHLQHFFDTVICAHDLGLPKEDTAFWELLREIVPFHPGRTLLVDDSLPVLESADRYGIRHLLAVATPNSRRPRKGTGSFAAVSDFRQIMPG